MTEREADVERVSYEPMMPCGKHSLAKAETVVGFGGVCPGCLHARLEKHEAALREIADHWPSQDKTGAEDYRTLRGFARKALQGGGERKP